MQNQTHFVLWSGLIQQNVHHEHHIFHLYTLRLRTCAILWLPRQQPLH